jgi:hypothetical protein
MSQAKLLHLDLETVPSGNKEEIEVKVPKNYTDKAKIKAYIDNNRDKQFRDRAKNVSTADIICFSGAFGKGDINTLISLDDEKALIFAIQDYVLENIKVDSGMGREIFELYFAGFNVRAYDLNLLWRKCIKYGAFDLARLIPRTRYDKRVIDLLEIWTGGAGISFDGGNKFSDVQQFLGMQPKRTGIDGSMVYDLYLVGDTNSIGTYCESDVEDEREMFDIMKDGLHLALPFMD